MKKVFIFMLMLLNIVAAKAVDTNGNFGFKQESDASAYQQYVGQTFLVRPAYGTLETWDKSGFKYSDEYAGKTFAVKKVTVKDVEINKKPNKEVTIEATEVGGKTKIKFKGYEEVTVKVGFWGGVKKWPLIGFMPIVLTEPFEAYKKEHMGETVENDMVKDKYEVVDVFMGYKKDSPTAVPSIKVRNMRTGDIVSCPYSERQTDPFAKALTGRYKLSLMKVEKPEDATDRYGETKTIQDEGVDKYSYNDSTIDITIFGSDTQFNFILKNVSKHSLKLIWNEAAFVGLDGSTSKIMHVGVKYSEREGDQPATTIIRGAKIDDIAVPTSNVYYDEGVTVGYSTIGNGWKTRSMLPEKYQGKEAGEIRLMLPIQVKDVVNEYTFVFKVYYTYDHPELLKTERL